MNCWGKLRKCIRKIPTPPPKALARSKRVFVAIWLPPSPSAELHEWAARLDGVRAVPLRNIHLTLAFLGGLSAADLERLTSKLREVKSPACSMRFTEIGDFRRQVLWLGVEPQPALLRLRERVRQACLEFVELGEGFVPHVTLARAKRLPPLGQLPPRPAPIAIGGFSLMTSESTPTGAVYGIMRDY